MAKLTKAQRHQAEQALSALMRAHHFLQDDRTAVCRRDKVATTTLHFTRGEIPEALQTLESRRLGQYALYEIDKGIGSDLCGMQTAIRHLQTLILGPMKEG